MGAKATFNCRKCNNRRTLPPEIAAEDDDDAPDDWYTENYKVRD